MIKRRKRNTMFKHFSVPCSHCTISFAIGNIVVISSSRLGTVIILKIKKKIKKRETKIIEILF